MRKGDTVRLHIEGVDLTHGFYIDGYEIKAVIRHAEITTVEFTANRAGSFRIRCFIPCGALHPFMIGKLIVEPDYKSSIFYLSSLSVPLITIFYLYFRETGKNKKEK